VSHLKFGQQLLGLTLEGKSLIMKLKRVKTVIRFKVHFLFAAVTLYLFCLFAHPNVRVYSLKLVILQYCTWYRLYPYCMSKFTHQCGLADRYYEC